MRSLQGLAMVLALAAGPVLADTVSYDGVNFHFARTDVPDFDQVRFPWGAIAGLPNSGKTYCVPTASLNWLAYIANRGYPNVAPGNSPWDPPQSVNTYNVITGNLFFLGLAMLTNPWSGTGSAKDAVALWLEVGAPGHFTVYEFFAHEYYSPRVADAGFWSALGGLVNIAYGWYTNPDENLPHMRKGGHAVTLVYAKNFDATSGELGRRDPAKNPDTNPAVQSAFTTYGASWNKAEGLFCGQTEDGWPVNCYQRTQDRVHTGSAYLDGMLVIIPKFGLGYTFGEIAVLTPIHLSGEPQRAIQRFAVPNGAKVLDVALNPFRIKHPYLTEGSEQIRLIDAITGQSSDFTRAAGARRLVYGGTSEDLYVLTSSGIQRFDRNGRQTATVAVETPLDAIAYDERNRRLVGASRSSGQLHFFSLALARLGSASTTAESLGREGRLHMSISPGDGSIWAFTEYERLVSHINANPGAPAGVRRIPVPAEATSPQGMSVDDRGIVYLTSAGRVYPLGPDGRLLRQHPFFGAEAGDGIQISRSFTNFDRRVHSGPGWANVLPEDADVPVPPR